ncbi:MAG: EAL domain-containing protein [Spirochaetales bacterium]|nr:EAL domain-containing protein [Leptospiraceae bacterium]MCP5483374.1 EAL domain-containing protein [Spirochaetales bacterium]MCP5484477.1 EAL domain-containing protein [Spirochaetales bacterium]
MSGRPSIDRVVPYFQPIVALDDQNIHGYEVLGRLRPEGEGSVTSLGQFFHDAKLELSYVHEIDRHVQEQAIRRLQQADPRVRLFLNVMPRLLADLCARSRFAYESFHIVQLVERYSIDPRRIVIEITEDEFRGEHGELVGIVQALRQFGFRIAVDDLGAGMSGLARLAYLQPDIIKVDLHLLQKSLTDDAFRRLLVAIGFVAQRLGAELLFEGVEVEEELSAALKMGGRYLQGFYFSPAVPDFIPPETYQANLKNTLQDYTRFRVAEMIQSYLRRDGIFLPLQQAGATFSNVEFEQADAAMREYLPRVPDQVRSAALFDFEGNQISSNFVRAAGEWEINPVAIGNISWRNIFQQTVANYLFHKQTYLISDPVQKGQQDYPFVQALLVVADNRIVFLEMDWID